MQVFFGPHAHSESSRRRLLQRLRSQGIPLVGLHARLLYCLDLEAPLTEAETERLRFLLGRIGQAMSAQGVHLRVLPRAGTISPWSSKATDILRIAGLSKVRRIECGRHYVLEADKTFGNDQRTAATALLHDRMTEQVCPDGDPDNAAAAALFTTPEPPGPTVFDLGAAPERRLAELNETLGLSLSADQIAYLADYYGRLGRPVSDAELMMFAQVNSEHCRHRIFNAAWSLGGQAQPSSLFDMVRHTHASAPEGVLIAYDDNAAVVEGTLGVRWQIDPATREYGYAAEALPILMKVETHNHPTAISPFPGAATGSGGEIRDEVAVGRGGRPKAGLCGFTVSDLHLPDAPQPWEDEERRPAWIASPLQVMREGPIGAAAFNNEYGRPCLAGYFRTFEHRDGEKRLGYHKPIMVAGGFGNLREAHVRKRKFPPGTPIVVLGGPAMLVGLRGGTASSRGGAHDEALDFASVQRDNAEMQRRCQEVIEHCAARGKASPILAIHDVGAGGLSNAVPELLAGAGVGGRLELRDVPNADRGMSAMEIWCNEAQERYVLAVEASALDAFMASCARERCPAAVIGEAVEGERLLLTDSLCGEDVIDMPLPVLLEKPARLHKDIALTDCPGKVPSTQTAAQSFPAGVTVEAAAERVLALPAVGSKSFLITIGDRSVGGLSVRDQMVGPWQVPVADCAVCAADFVHYAGEAMAMGERTPVAVGSAPASGRLAVAEAVTNLLAADVRTLRDVRLSANWMAASGNDADDLALFRTVQAVAEALCPALGIAIPVGKDSLSMQVEWRDEAGRHEQVKSPLSLIVSAFAPVGDVRRSWTPQLIPRKDHRLYLFNLSAGQARLGGSALAQVFKRPGKFFAEPCADLDDPSRLGRFAALTAQLHEQGGVTAYHDRSDGGLFVTLCEMAFAGRCGLDVDVEAYVEASGGDVLAALFNEEPGAVVQVAPEAGDVMALAERHGLADACFPIGCADDSLELRVAAGGRQRRWDLMALKRRWWDIGYRIQSLRDDPDCAREELESVCDPDAPGLSATLTFDLEAASSSRAAPLVGVGARPKAAVLREQGINGHYEMAAAFDRAGFTAVDVHINDLLNGEVSLAQFHGLAACGGFSYGDVLGAGRGWAASILFHDAVRAEFEAFFARGDTFTLGVCNGCQMLTQLKTLIPGAEHFPRFEVNRSSRFEARLCMVEVMESPSLLLRGMAGSHLPIVVAHGEGRAVFEGAESGVPRAAEPYVCLRYAERRGSPAERYPANPNGSPGGATALCSEDGRVTVMMPHPERLFRSVQYSWRPAGWSEAGAWFTLFRNARTLV